MSPLWVCAAFQERIPPSHPSGSTAVGAGPSGPCVPSQGCQDPLSATAATGREGRRLRSFRLVGDPRGLKAAEAAPPHTVPAAGGTCWWWGDGSVRPRCDIRALSLLGEPPARTVATSKDLQPLACAGGRTWDPAVAGIGARMAPSPRPSWARGEEVAVPAGAARRGHRQGQGSEERVQQEQWAALCPTQANACPGALAPPSHGPTLSGGSPGRL